jgi:hypothetical protein
MFTNRLWRPIRPLALFNLAEEPRTLRYLWKDLGLPAARYRLRQLAESIDNSKPSASPALIRRWCQRLGHPDDEAFVGPLLSHYAQRA